MPSNCDFSSQLNEIKDLIGSGSSFDPSSLESQISALEARIEALEPQLPVIQANALAGMNAGQAAMAAIATLSLGLAALEAKAAITEGLARQAQQQALQAIGVGGQAINMAGNAQNAANGALQAARDALGKAGSALGQAASNAGKIAGLIGKVAGIAAAIAGVGGLALGLANQAAINDLNRDMQDANARDRQHARDIEGLNKRADQLNDKIAQVQRALEKQISDLGSQFAKALQGVRDSISDVWNNLNARLGAAVSALWAAINGLRGNSDTNINNRINNLESDLANTNNNVGAIGGKVSSLDSKVGAMGNDLQGLWGRTGSLGDAINNLGSRVRANSGNIAGLLGTVAALGLAVAALQARKLMCRYNDAQVNAIAQATAATAATTTALQGILNSIVIPFTQATTATLTALTTGVDTIKNGVTSGFKWLAIDRVLNIANLIGTLHNATFLSRDIVESMLDIADTVLQIMGKELKDSEGNQISTGELISGRIERAIIEKIGLESYAELRTRWNRFSTIYMSAANVFGNLRSISDSIISGVEIAASYSAKIGNSLMRFGVLPEKVFPWMSETPNFDNKLITRLEKGEEVVSSLSSVTSEVLSISEESKEIANNSLELKARLASKNPEDGTDWNVENGVQAEKDQIQERATQFSNVTFDDIPYSE